MMGPAILFWLGVIVFGFSTWWAIEVAKVEFRHAEPGEIPEEWL